MIDYIVPDWPAPAHVKALFTTRNGGVSSGENNAYTSLNLGLHVNDHPNNVKKNRALLHTHLPNEPRWLKQVHGTDHIWAEHVAAEPQADAAFSRQARHVCAIMVADCLPVYLCDDSGTTVGVIHAGWRGLAAGIIERSVTALEIKSKQLIAWLGPAIGPNHFEVGTEVKTAFVQHDPQAERAFKPVNHRTNPAAQKWLADIFLLARQRLEHVGVTRIYGGGICTYSDPQRFFSYRRDGETGRMAAFIWLEKPF